MAFMQYIVINGVSLPMPDSYDVEMSDVEADSGGETEAGTKQRDVVRMGVTVIAVTFSVTSYWLKKLTEYKQMRSLTVRFFNPNTVSFKTSQMYIDGYKAELVKDTSYMGLWKVWFKLKEF